MEEWVSARAGWGCHLAAAVRAVPCKVAGVFWQSSAALSKLCCSGGLASHTWLSLSMSTDDAGWSFGTQSNHTYTFVCVFAFVWEQFAAANYRWTDNKGCQHLRIQSNFSDFVSEVLSTSLFRKVLRIVRDIYGALILCCHTGVNDIFRAEELSWTEHSHL